MLKGPGATPAIKTTIRDHERRGELEKTRTFL
jgi:hypothetical protein